MQKMKTKKIWINDEIDAKKTRTRQITPNNREKQQVKFVSLDEVHENNDGRQEWKLTEDVWEQLDGGKGKCFTSPQTPNGSRLDDWGNVRGADVGRI